MPQYQKYLAAVEEPVTGRKKVTRIRCAWHTLQSKQSAEWHGMNNVETYWLSFIKKAIEACGESKRLCQQARELQEASQETIIESTKLVRESERNSS